MAARQVGRAGRGKVLRAVVLVLGGAVVIAGLWYLLTHYPFFGPPGVVVRNSTPHRLAIVEAVLEYPGGGTTTERFGDLGPGEERAFSPAANDFRVRLLFVLGGREYVHHDTVDLWRGETYLFDIQPNGSVVTGYEPRGEPDRH